VQSVKNYSAISEGKHKRISNVLAGVWCRHEYCQWWSHMYTFMEFTCRVAPQNMEDILFEVLVWEQIEGCSGKCMSAPVDAAIARDTLVEWETKVIPSTLLRPRFRLRELRVRSTTG
jgi:hypothetical protein